MASLSKSLIILISEIAGVLHRFFLKLTNTCLSLLSSYDFFADCNCTNYLYKVFVRSSALVLNWKNSLSLGLHIWNFEVEIYLVELVVPWFDSVQFYS